MKNQPTCAYCRAPVFRGEGTWLRLPRKRKKLLVHKKCEERAKELIENKGRGYYSLIQRGKGNPKRLGEMEEVSVTEDLLGW